MATMEKEISNRIAIQSSIAGNFSGNNHSNNQTTVNNYGIQVPSHVPATFEELVARNGWEASPPEIDLDYLCDEYNLPQGETGKWIFKEVGYREWRERRESRLLWLCGGPGTGKTMLAKRVVAEFLRGPDPPSGVKAVFHFLPPELPTKENSADEDRSSQLSLAKLASDLLYSILQQNGNLFDGCKAELGKEGDRFFTNPSSLWKVLRKTIQDCQTDPIYIFIDGVDGLGGRSHEELMRRILGLIEIRTVKIFLSCRDVPYISNNLPHNPHEYTKIDLDTNNFIKADVETFIRRRVNAWGWDMELRERAMECLLAKSDGIFLWASLAVKSLTYFHLGLDFDEFLRKLPLRLTDVYRTMLHKLFLQGEPEIVLNMIQSVALALRPLKFSELGYILACIEGKAKEEKGPCYRIASNEIRPRSEKEIRMYVQSSMGFLRATNTTVSIVHHTAIEYLFDENRKDSLPVLSKSATDLTISWECFQYLHHAFGGPEKLPEGAVTGHCNGPRDSSLGRDYRKKGLGETPWELTRKTLPEAVVQWPYLRYAAESWFIHARRSIEISKDNFWDNPTHNWLQHQFFETSDVIRKPWIELCGDSRMEVLAGEQTPLHIAICLGLMPLAEKALRDFPEGASSKGLLHLAARFISGVYKIIIAKCNQSLLTDPDQDGNTPLHGAAISGHSSMLHDLVKELRGSRVCSNEVNKTNHFGNTPLHLAFQFDHPEIVDLLIKEGADLTIKNNAQLTASELGAKLERGESLDILKQDEEERAEARKEVLKEPPYVGENLYHLPITFSSNNTIILNNYSIQRPSYCAKTFEELIARTGWKTSPPEIDLNHLCGEHDLPLADTGRWIFEDVGYKEWRESQGSGLLWLCGAPGTGKTMLVKRVAAEFLKGPDNPPSQVKLAFDFILPEISSGEILASEGELVRLTLAKVAWDLLYSILQQDGNLFYCYEAQLQKQGERLFADPNFVWKILREAVQDSHADPIYILIDGLDELNESLCKKLIEKILGLRDICTVKIFLSSRDVPHVSNYILRVFYQYTKIDLDINSFVKEDVGRFISYRVDGLGWDVGLRRKAKEILLVKSEGTFLWVSLMIERLARLSSGIGFEKILNNLPPDLEKLYRNMLHAVISRDYSGEVLNTIQSVVFALRPLTFGELGYTLAWMEEKVWSDQPPRREASRETRSRTEKEIRKSVRSSMGFLRATDTTVSIVHHTAMEFLVDRNGEDNLSGLSNTKADLTISWECFRYLHDALGDLQRFRGGNLKGRHSRPQDSSLGRDYQEEKQEMTQWEVALKDPLSAVAKWPYLRYAAESWFIHAQRSIEVSKDKFYNKSTHNWLQHPFFGTSDVIRRPWIELCGDPKMEVLAGEQTPLHIAVCLGLMPLVEKTVLGFVKTNQSPLDLGAKLVFRAYKTLIAKERKEINDKNSSGNTPLHLASKFDYPEIVQFLAKNGADPAIKNNAQLTASELGAKLGKGYSLEETRGGAVVVPIEGPGRR